MNIHQAARDLLSRLLVRDPKMRLGSGDLDASEVKSHPFFSDVDWVGLMEGRVSPPWSPQVAGSLDVSQFDQEFTSMRPIGAWISVHVFVYLLLCVFICVSQLRARTQDCIMYSCIFIASHIRYLCVSLNLQILWKIYISYVSIN